MPKEIKFLARNYKINNYYDRLRKMGNGKYLFPKNKKRYKILTMYKKSARIMPNIVPNSFCNTKKAFHKLILQNDHSMMPLTIVLAKSTTKKINMFCMVP